MSEAQLFSTSAATKQPTKADWKVYDRRQAALGKIHDCDPDNWDARVSSPGFDLRNGAGLSTWTCAVCRPFVADMVDGLYGAHEVIPRKKAS